MILYCGAFLETSVQSYSEDRGPGEPPVGKEEKRGKGATRGPGAAKATSPPWDRLGAQCGPGLLPGGAGALGDA